MRRLVNENEMWFSFGELMAGQNAEAATLGLDQPHVVHDMTFPSDLVSEGAYGEPVHLSRTQRRKLDKEFGPNADVVVFFRRLSRDEAKALKHLHEYRNGAYHRNVLNLRTVGVLVQLQLSVVVSLLRATPQAPTTRIYPPIDWEPMREVLGLPPGSPVSYRVFADILERGIDLTGDEVSEILGGNLRDRLVQVKRRIGDIREQMAVPGVTFEDWVALVQTPQPWPVGTAEIRSHTPAVTLQQLELWETASVTRAESDTALRAFGRFADVDSSLTGLEDAIEAVEIQLDREIQRLIDERRGK